MAASIQEINFNGLLDKSIDTLQKLPYLKDSRLFNIYINIIAETSKKQNELDQHKLYTFLLMYLTKIDDLNSMDERYLKVIVNHLVVNRLAIGNDKLVFEVLDLLLQRKFDDSQTFINLLSFIILKVVFVFKVTPSEEALTFLSVRVIDHIEAKQLALICPGIVTNLVKILVMDLKHSVKVFKMSLEILSALLVKIQDYLSSNEKILVYQSVEALFKSWVNTIFPSNHRTNELIIDCLCKPLASFQLLNELVCTEFIFRSQNLSEAQLTFFETSQIVFILTSKIKMVDVFYFDMKNFRLFVNGLRIIAQRTDVPRMGGLFASFIDMTVDARNSREFKKKGNNSLYNENGIDGVNLPSFFSFDNIPNNRDKEVSTDLMTVAVKSDLDVHEAVVEKYVPLEIREKWLEIVSHWVKFLDRRLLVDLLVTNELDEKRLALYYYVLFHIESSTDEIDDMLTFEDDSKNYDLNVFCSEQESEEELLLEYCMDLLETTKDDLPISNLYFINNYISSTNSYGELKELEVDLLPFLLTNVTDSLAQHILQNLSLKLYPAKTALSSFKMMINENCDLILSHITTVIVASGSESQKKWITFTKNVFEVCGIDLVKKAGDVVNLMFQVLALDSISAYNSDEESAIEIMTFFGLILDLILAEYNPKKESLLIESRKRMEAVDVIALFKKTGDGFQQDCDDVEEEIVANDVSQDSKSADPALRDTSFEGIVPQLIYELVIEICAYTERYFPVLSNKIVLIQNITKCTEILSLNEKSFKPQLAQTIWPLIDHFLRITESNMPAEITLAISLVKKILLMEPKFMMQRVKILFLDTVVERKLIGGKELGHVICDIFSRDLTGCAISDGDLVRIRYFLK